MSANLIESLNICRYVFVYGTLQKDYGNHCWLRTHDGKSTFVCEAITDYTFGLKDCGFPYMYKSKDNAKPVRGEVYEIHCPDALASTDTLEGVENNHYKRILTNVTQVGEKVSYEVWAYIAHESLEMSESNLPFCKVICGEYKWG